MLKIRLWITLLGWLSLAWPAMAIEPAGANALIGYNSRFHPIIARSGMVSTQDRIASQVGADILARGGNAVDAAVAIGFALAVSHPQAGNLGGGGFMLINLSKTNEVIALDFRETAPAAASHDMFLDPQGNVSKTLAQESHLSAGVPGTVMGLLGALETYGTMNRRQIMGPAIKLAQNGIPVSYALAYSLNNKRDKLARDPSSLTYFGGGKHGYKPGDKLVQKDLAETLRRILNDGRDGFYAGKTADLIVEEMRKGHGLITHADLADYKIIHRQPVTGSYKGYEIFSMPPPSSGGVHIIQMLNILSGYNLQADGHNSAAYIHKLAEAMRRAFADRSKYLGDPDFFNVPVEALIDPAYGAYLRKTIDLKKASLSTDITPATNLPYESHETTHYSVLDKQGNAVAVTYTLNFSYGSGYSVDGAGFLLNNQMDDFSAKPGSANGYGLIGGEANKIEARKRPLSSMTPVIVRKNGQIRLVTGSPGGSTIITSVLQMLLNVLEWDMNLSQATNVARIHHQWLPDILAIEPGINRDTVQKLQQIGHKFPTDKQGNVRYVTLGRVNSVAQSSTYQIGAADPRGPKSAAIGVE